MKGLFKNIARFKSMCCFLKKKVVTSSSMLLLKTNKNKKNTEIVINKNKLKMRNKDLFEQKLERFEAEVKTIGYLIHRNETAEAYDKVAVVLEQIGDLRTLLNTEHQD